MTGPKIHPSATVESGAELADGVIVEAMAFVGKNCKIGPNTHIQRGAIIRGTSTLGANNIVFPYACLGMEPQDLKFAGEESYLIVGDNNVFREFCAIHRGTEHGGLKTEIGNNNLFMTHAHVGHDCKIADNGILSASTGLAGHIELESHVILGGFTGIHQFVRVGRGAMASGGSKIGKDLPPYFMCQGAPSKARGINIVGLQRAGVDTETIAAMRTCYRKFYQDDAVSVEQRIETVIAALGDHKSDQTQQFLEFVSQKSNRGLMFPERNNRGK